MNETQMIDAIKRDVDVTRVTDGVYVFNFGDKFGAIRNYLYDKDHYEIIFDNLTPEQVVEVFGTKPEASDVQEIVRCRDCRFGYQHDCKRYPKDKKYRGKWYCIVWGDGMQGEWTKADGFCHRGKPRSE